MDDATLPTEAEPLTALRQKAKVWLNQIGSVLGIAGVLFVCAKLYQYQGQIRLQTISPIGYAALVGLAVAYGASNILLALAWKNLLTALNSPVSTRWAIWAYAVSQIAKYVPGNIFQFAGRQALGLAAGRPGWPLAKSTAWELLLISACGAVFGILVIPLLSVLVSIAGALLLFFATTIVLFFAVRMLWNPQAASVVFYYITFLAFSGLVFLGTLAVVDKITTEVGATSIIGAYVISWLAGLLTPGAPAGLGVREAVLLMLLSGHIGDPVILLALVFGRAVTISGDLMFYVAGRFVPCD
jgi:glycosyltransferase 2 family protein